MSAADKRMVHGVVWAVRYARGGRPEKNSIQGILAKEIERIMDTLEQTEEGITGRGLAAGLLFGLKMGASGDPGYVAENEVVRKGWSDEVTEDIVAGVPMIARLEEMVQDAWDSYTEAHMAGDELKARGARGRVRGLAQALAFVKSPTSWENGTPGHRGAMVKDQENALSRRRKVT